MTHFAFDRSNFLGSVSIRHAYDHWDSGLVTIYTLNQVSVMFSLRLFFILLFIVVAPST